MLTSILKRLLWTVPLLFVVTLLSFVLASLAPGSVAVTILGRSATPSSIAAFNQKFGYDRPVLTQYGDWLSHAVHGDLGGSVYSDQPVTSILADRLPVTLSLTVLGLAVVIVAGVSIGMLTAIRGGAMARVMEVVAVALRSIPNFWLALVLAAIFAVQLLWLPVSGYIDFGVSPVGWITSLILPVASLTVGEVALVAIVSRAELLTAMRSDYIRGLRANGFSPTSILFRHVLKNAAPPILTVVSLVFVGLLGGTILIEQIFGMGGLGSQMVSSTQQHDLPVIQGLVVFYTLVVVVVFLANDVLSGVLNPKASRS